MSIDKHDNDKADALQDSFFSLMATQLESAAISLSSPFLHANPEPSPPAKPEPSESDNKVRSDSVRSLLQSVRQSTFVSPFFLKRYSEPTLISANEEGNQGIGKANRRIFCLEDFLQNSSVCLKNDELSVHFLCHYSGCEEQITIFQHSSHQIQEN